MQVTRQQILNGTANYIRDEMIPHVPDKRIPCDLGDCGRYGADESAVSGKSF